MYGVSRNCKGLSPVANCTDAGKKHLGKSRFCMNALVSGVDLAGDVSEQPLAGLPNYLFAIA